MPRTPGKYGRRPPKNAPAIRLADVLTGTVPPHPAAADYLATLPGWQMLGNDEAGDCVAVTWANTRRLVTAALAAEHYPTQAQVWSVYRTQNPDFNPDGTPDDNGPGSEADQGMDIQTLLEYLAKHGGPDGVKAVAFAKVDHTNPDEVKAAIAILGSVWTAVNVTAANETEFGQGKPWNYVSGSPNQGGHSIITGGYGPKGTGPLGGDERFITWAEETSFTDTFWAHQVEEAWAVIWPEHLGTREFETGVSVAALAQAYQQITGRTLPIPAPPPAPVAFPAAAAKAWLGEPHAGADLTFANLLAAWMRSSGYPTT